MEGTNIVTRLYRLGGFLLFYIWEVIASNFKVAYDVLTPKFKGTPEIIDVPLEKLTDLQLTLLANLITMTPGTLSLDVLDEGRTLRVHTMYLEDADTFAQSIKNDFEKRILNAV